MNTTITLTINPEPVVNTFTSNIPTVSQGSPVTLIVDMAIGTPPFTINLVDDDIPSNPYALSITPPIDEWLSICSAKCNTCYYLFYYRNYWMEMAVQLIQY